MPLDGKGNEGSIIWTSKYMVDSSKAGASLRAWPLLVTWPLMRACSSTRQRPWSPVLIKIDCTLHASFSHSWLSEWGKQREDRGVCKPFFLTKQWSAAVHDGVPRYMTAIFDQGSKESVQDIQFNCMLDARKRERMQVRVIATLSFPTCAHYSHS
jgi:hypothetical protein